MSPTNRPKMSNKTTSVLTGYQILSEHSLWYAGRDSVHYGAGGVQPPPGRGPADTCISMFESLPKKQKRVIPNGITRFWHRLRILIQCNTKYPSVALPIQHCSCGILSIWTGLQTGHKSKKSDKKNSSQNRRYYSPLSAKYRAISALKLSPPPIPNGEKASTAWWRMRWTVRLISS